VKYTYMLSDAWVVARRRSLPNYKRRHYFFVTFRELAPSDLATSRVPIDSYNTIDFIPQCPQREFKVLVYYSLDISSILERFDPAYCLVPVNYVA
jgi:hypothetical protein